MIDIWLKCRDRGNLNFVLKHLSYWLGAFSDPEKYRIFLYVENFDMPPAYKNAYHIVRHFDLLNQAGCKDLFDRIQRSTISKCWKPAAFALMAPYFYDHTSDIIVNIDSDDIFIPGNITEYIDKAINIMDQYNLPTLSYDYILSYNLFDKYRPRPFIKNHWSMGVNIARKLEMQKLANQVINNVPHYTRYYPTINHNFEVNIDVLLSAHLLNERQDLKYVAFITKEGFYHNGFPNGRSYCSKYANGNFIWSFTGENGISTLFPKTVVLE